MIARLPAALSLRRLTSRTRALLAASLSVVAVLGGNAALGVLANLRDAERMLLERAELLATIQADALAVPMWNFDDAQVRATLAALALDPDFHAARLLDAEGELLTQRRGPAATRTMRVRHPIAFMDGRAPRALGTLELELSTARLAVAQRRDVRRESVALITVAGAVLLAVYAAFRQITRPLDLMARVTSRLAAGDHDVMVPAQERHDEVGAVARSIQVFKERTIALAHAKEEYRAIYEHAALGIYRSTPDGRLISANPAFVRLTGYASEGELLEAWATAGSATRWYVEPGRRLEFASLIGEHRGVTGLVSQIRRRDGSVVWVSETARAVRDADGALASYEGTVEDVTERKRLEEEERVRARAAIDSAGDAIAIADPQGLPVYLNPAFRQLLGHEPGELAERGGLASLFAEPELGRAAIRALAAGGRWSGEAELAASGDRLIPAAVRGSAIGDEAGRAVGSVLIITDISDRRAAEARIRYMAHHDALTGLPNRLLFRDRLEQALARARRAGEPVAVLALDLDKFKEVNDTLGHHAGDGVLETVAERLRSTVREADTIARLGGDEFAIVQVGLAQPAGADALARRIVSALSAPFDLDGSEVMLGTSVGIAVYPTDGEGGDGADGLVRRADLALYRAKGDGRGTHRFFEPRMDTRLQARRRQEGELRRALASRQLELHYQPQVDLADGRITGAEALLRWHTADRGFVPPGEFIPLAEETGLIIPIGAWVLETACAAAAGWPAPLRIAVNLSPLQLRQPAFAAGVAQVLRRTGLAPSRLELEITEGMLMHDTETTLATMRTLKAAGVRLAMDDFGTGYSSLGYLRDFPFDKIKIDRSFVHGLGKEAGASTIVRAIVGLGRGLAMQANAEGVETAEQAALLRAEGCDEVQGYLYARPMPESELVRLITGHGQRAA